MNQVKDMDNINVDERYENGKIYLILSKESNMGYIGSTIQTLENRLRKHNTDMNGYLGLLPKKRNYRSSFEVLIYEDYQIILLENFDCCNRRELEKREAMWILKLSNKIKVVNILMPSKIDFNDIDYIKDNLIIPVF